MLNSEIINVPIFYSLHTYMRTGIHTHIHTSWLYIKISYQWNLSKAHNLNVIIVSLQFVKIYIFK